VDLKKIKKNKVIENINKIDFKKLLDYTKIEILPGNYVINKYKWVNNIYVPFSKIFQSNPYPLQPGTVAAFIKFCLLECKYSINTVVNIIIPILKFKEKEHNYTTEIRKEIDDAIKITLKNVRNNYKINEGTNGKEPCLLIDLYKIIDKMNIFINTYHEEISIYLIAIYSGARSVTMENILLNDLLYFYNINKKKTKVEEKEEEKEEDNINERLESIFYMFYLNFNK